MMLYNGKIFIVSLGMMSHWIYDKSPLDGIQFETPLKQLKDELSSGVPVFQELIKKYLVNNEHRITVEMTPDAEMEAKRVKDEESMLATVKASMNEQQINEVIEMSKALREAQEAIDSPEAKATLPKLGLEDISPIAKELPIKVLQNEADLNDATVLLHELQTSGILYADVAFDYSSVDPEDLELLPLFSRMLMEAGTSKYDLTSLSRKIGSTTGGIGVSYYNDLVKSAGKVADQEQVLLHLLIRGKAVVENIPILFELFQEILQNTNFNNQKRAIEMLKESKVRKESSVLSAGHSYGVTRLGGRSSFLGYLNEITSGLSSVHSAGPLLNKAIDDWSSIQVRLERIRDLIVKKGKSSLVVNLTGDEKLLQQTLPTVKSFISSLPSINSDDNSKQCNSHIMSKWNKDKLLPIQNEAFVMPSQVNYVVMGGPILEPGEKVKASYSVVSRYLNTGYLWDQVRVVGGAYGGFARFSSDTGRFAYISYRDPNCFNTLTTYDRTPEFLADAIISSEDVLQAVIGAIGDLDSPMGPDQKGFESMIQYLSSESAEDRQTYRTEVLNTNPEDFKEFSKLLSKLDKTGSIVVFGAAASIEATNAKLPDERKMIVDQALPPKSG